MNAIFASSSFSFTLFAHLKINDKLKLYEFIF